MVMKILKICDFNHLNYKGIFKKRTLLHLLIAFGLSLVIAAIGGGLSFLVPEYASMAVAILSRASLILASLIGAAFFISSKES